MVYGLACLELLFTFKNLNLLLLSIDIIASPESDMRRDVLLLLCSFYLLPLGA
ncbi:serine protease, partial [Acinetobacter baumannii]|nr:serine protease [Acinetobacter baumannii]